ncbi:chymotrypsinogen 2-like [Ambystoma mexicanum]|uniref:chymotrypsinogen 2-like n=1 Tax=Ambystoma mexicanum TaxID=8296 RepID=UPI0037E86849
MALLWLLSCLAFASTALGCGEQDIYPVLSGFARVANGEEAVPGSWPWQVSVQEKDGWHVCGGSLISSRWVITSITCSVSTAHLVVLGEHDRGNNTEVVKTVSIAQGDTGGPLACERYGVWYLIGVASWGSSTCTSSSPAVYSRVTALRPWIDMIIMAN